MKKPVAIQLYSVREQCEKDFPGTLTELKRMGYNGVEFAGLYGYTAKEVKVLLKDIGLTPISAHVSYEDMTTKTEQMISDYSEIGVKYIGIPYLVEEHRPGGAKYAETIASMKELSTLLKAKGIQLLYHNHDFEFTKIDGKYMLDILYTDLSKDELQTELDLCWVAVGGENPANYLRKYSGRAPVVHFKDFYIEGQTGAKLYDLIGIDDNKPADKSTFEYRPIGTGLQDIGAMLKAVDDAGCEWIIIEQDEPTASKPYSRLECAEISIINLKKY
ncbi:MAG: sugar phosphate isomerase [Clostridiales bacterium GWF2_38_85]|nr:MAG: sugar phosphate isomerase [Clostridiales bacterium GWF2_38_85]HBL85392.1 sugar phosphate isomerase/epimerase [Clostridiales bacterium]